MNKLMCTKVYALVLMLFAAVSVYGQDNVIDEVVWVVGDEAILKSDVENERLNAQYEGRKFDGDPYCIIPEQLAIQKLFLHQAAIDSIEVSEQEIISDVERRTNWLIDQIGSKEKVEEYYNKTSTQIREMLRENIRDGKTVQKMQQQMEQAQRASEQETSQEEEAPSEETSPDASTNPTLANENTSSTASHSVGLPSEYLLNSTIRLFHQMGQIFRDNAAPPSNPMGIRVDSKRRKKLMQKRLAMGHKQDDHEQNYGQTLQ